VFVAGKSQSSKEGEEKKGIVGEKRRK